MCRLAALREVREVAEKQEPRSAGEIRYQASLLSKIRRLIAKEEEP
jgi:hypothetical protein